MKLFNLNSKLSRQLVWAAALALLTLQATVPALGQGVLRAPQTGVIQEAEGLGEAQILISGTVYSYDMEEGTVFTLQGEEINDSDLRPGMVVRFTLEDGILGQVQVLGPNNIIENINTH